MNDTRYNSLFIIRQNIFKPKKYFHNSIISHANIKDRDTRTLKNSRK